MKAIRGDNPRTTNQRVYLMPVVPPPPPEKPPTPDVEQFSLSFPLSLYIGASLLSICLSARPPLVPFPLVLSAYRASSTLHLSRSSSLLCWQPLRSRSRVITLLLSDMSLCYRHNQPRAPVSLFAPLLARSLARWAALFAALPRRVICNVSYARASPRSSAISAIILIFMPTPPPPLLSPRHILARFLSLSPSAVPRGGKANRKQIH